MGRRRMPGEGSVYRRSSDGRWVAQLSTGSRTSRIVRTRYARTRADAKLALEELRAAGSAARLTMTTGDFLAQWAVDVRNIRPTTRHGYENVVALHLVPTLGHVRLRDLGPLDVERALTVLAPRMSPKSLRNVYAVLRRALGQAVKATLIPRNPADRTFVDPPRFVAREAAPLSEADEAALVAASVDDWMGPLIVTALGTGLRQGELLGLAWEDIDLDGASLRVRQELVRINGKYRRDEPKTERSKRTVPLTPAVVAAIRSHRERVIAAGFVPTRTGPVFTNLSGGPLNGSYVTHRLYALCAKAGIERVPFKVFRTTFSSRLSAAGVNDRTISDLMGHTRTATTQTHYVATSPEAARRAIASLAPDSHADSHGELVTLGVGGH